MNFYKIFRVFSLNGTGHFLSRAAQDFFLRKRHTVFFFAHGTPRFPRIRNIVLFFFMRRNKLFFLNTYNTYFFGQHPCFVPRIAHNFFVWRHDKKNKPRRSLQQSLIKNSTVNFFKISAMITSDIKSAGRSVLMQYIKRHAETTVSANQLCRL